MLALLSLFGLALAGTAFVGGMPSSDDHDAEAAEDNSFEASEPQIETGAEASMLTEFDGADVLNDPIIEVAESVMTQPTDGTDIIVGGDGDDDINGLLGDDYINGGGGNDELTGGGGNDEIHGSAGDDLLYGDDGDDLAYSYVGNDEMYGGAGDDKLHGGDGSDFIDGGYDDDELLGGHGDDTLIGGAGRDNLQGSEGDDIVDGVTGEEAGAEKDYLNGSEGNDRLIGNDGDVMSGGEGVDQFEIIGDGVVSIMDYAEDEFLIVNYEGTTPVLTTETTPTGVMLLADGAPIASLYGLTTFDIGSVQLVAA